MIHASHQGSNMLKKSHLFIMGSLLVLLSFCTQRQKDAKGPNDIVYILANKETKEKLKSALDTTFAYGMVTPRFQPYFQTSWYPIKKYHLFAEYKNLIVIADLKEEDLDKRIAKAVLPAEKYQLAAADSLFIFSSRDQWARGQAFVLIAGKDPEEMRRNIIEQREWIFQKFNQPYLKRGEQVIYRYGEQRNLTRYLYGKYHWTLRIPKEWEILQEQPENNFLWLGKSMPYRWISVHWTEGVNSRLLTPNGLLEKRQEIGQLYDHIKTDTLYLRHRFTKFATWDALRMSGLWYHAKQAKGGPFATYSFYDGNTDHTYIIDFLLYDPARRVTNYFRQTEIIARTFVTQYDEDTYK